ncbi:MAG TPA: helix-hairpin-helix domain-containing protein [Candidatus Acidoferrum sp.]
MLTRLLLVPLLIGALAAGPAQAKKKPPAQPINLNTANSAQLQQVPGIGPATAEKILQMRKSYGAFKSVNDLLAIRGLGPKRLEKMRKYLTVNKTAAQSSNCTGCAKQKPPPRKLATTTPKNQPAAAKPSQSEAESEEP